MAVEEDEKPGVPAYMVSFGDMVTLLLTFFILLVAMADTQTAGLVGVGKGPIVRHVLADGRPGIMGGRTQQDRKDHKRDAWWIPDQEGDPDELELVREQLRRELKTRFRADQYQIDYDRDRVVLRLPLRLNRSDDIDADVRAVLAAVKTALRGHPERHVRINADVPAGRTGTVELLDSAHHARRIYDLLTVEGISREQMTIWGWGATRPLFQYAPELEDNRVLTLEILELDPTGD